MPITLKYISTIHRNKLDHSPNPLNSSVSLNHKQGRNSKAKGKLSTHETSKPPRDQAIASLVIPIKGEVIQLSGERSRSKGKKQ
jgi:hypothetical protein